MILAGDVGGTKCNLALFDHNGPVLRQLFQRRYLTIEYAKRSFEDMLGDFRGHAAESYAAKIDITAAAIGSAGAIVDGRVHPANVPWPIDSRKVATKLGLQKVFVINDLEATALSLDRLPPEDFLVLNEGSRQVTGTKALLAAGTGLGEAIMFWDGHRHHVAPSEGGHTDFAPHNEREIEFLRFLKKRLPYISNEQVLSGRGFRSIHEFLDSSVRHASFDGNHGDPAKEITELGLAQSCNVCVETLDFWTASYGSEAGNLALRVLAFGGVYVAGGIVLKVLPKMKDGTFVRSFCDKAGDLKDILSQIPIYAVLNEDAPLWGAAYQALAAINA